MIDLERKPGLLRGLFSWGLHKYFLITRGLTLGVRAIVRTGDDKFLLVRHTYTPGWHLPGGGVEKGESIEDALKSELGQETGLKLVGKPKLHGVFQNIGVSRRDHVFVYLCEVAGELPTRPSSMEIAELGYFKLEDLPRGIDAGTERRIGEVVYGKEPPATW